ncbi:MAG: CpsD/CapB family tyrosine-protein kinase [Halanaerobiaceae bacterium]
MKSNKISERSEELIAREHPYSPVTEAFRSLRTELSFISPDNPLKSLLVTSSDKGEGKSILTSNLAISMAQNNRQVRVIDADLRRPVLHRIFNLPNHTGLSSFLSEDLRPEDIIQNTEIDGLSIISSGPIPPNPAELLSSQKMLQLLHREEEEVDLVLLDTPPVIIVSDAVGLSPRVGGVLLVVAARETARDKVRATRNKLEQVGANIVGSVLNRYPVGKAEYFYEAYF